MFNCFIAEIRKIHLDKVKTNMLDILSMILDEDDKICRQLQLDLLAIWREELVVSPCAYKLAKGLIEQKIERFRGEMTEKELISLGLQPNGDEGKDVEERDGMTHEERAETTALNAPVIVDGDSKKENGFQSAKVHDMEEESIAIGRRRK
ncbi:hypothetical protein SUGI_0693840 [Cryptomeria japonica]|nr:hypothetical protein SUGI_0693840 [Cryptomeria japonica]